MLRSLAALALCAAALPVLLGQAGCGAEAVAAPPPSVRPSVHVDVGAVAVEHAPDESDDEGEPVEVVREAPLALAGSLAEALAWKAPIAGVVTSGFGHRALDDSFHDAIDVAAPMGADVVAPANLRIRTIAYQARAGRHVVADVVNDEGVVEWRMTFAHLSSVAVFEGDRVAKGEKIGAIGLSGTATGAHLHFRVEAVENGERIAVDPLTLFASGTFTH